MRQATVIGASGVEWVIEAHGCHSPALADLPKLRCMFSDIVTAMVLRPVGDPIWPQFPRTGGITGLGFLAECHLACHTFPDYQPICLNLFRCHPRPECDFA